MTIGMIAGTIANPAAAAATANTPFSIVTADPWVRVSASGQEGPATLTASVDAHGFRPGNVSHPGF
jgi:hypothetical protein